MASCKWVLPTLTIFLNSLDLFAKVFSKNLSEGKSFSFVFIAIAIVVLRLRHSDKLGLSKKRK